MAVLITGGAGFVGREVARMLLDRGEEVTVFSRSPTPTRLGDLADRVTAISGDVGNFSHVLDAVKASKPDVIYHLGAMLSVPSDADPASAIQSNAMGTFYVLEAARLFGVGKVVFSSSVATYGLDIEEDEIDDFTLQRPTLFYGATKAFGEHMGLVYKRKYGLDFRGIRYPSVVGPGVTTPGVAQYNSWVIEECAKGKPFNIWVPPHYAVPIMYVREAAEATVMLADAPVEAIKTVNYVVDGQKPTPTAEQLAEAVRAKIQGAEITFESDPKYAPLIRKSVKPLNDHCARDEWGWRPSYDLGRMIDEFLVAMNQS
jgi:threonine 3-dehydrogenase